MRLFIAAPLSTQVVERLGLVIERLRLEFGGAEDRFRWVDPEKAHLTLVFLGSVGSGRAAAVSEAMRGAAGETAPFDIRFEGVGAFRSWRDPRVVWLGVSQGSRELECLQRCLEERLKKLGFETEDRPFHPHLTLARIKGAPSGSSCRGHGGVPALEEKAQRIRDTATMNVGEMALFESRLSPLGASYTVLSRQALNPGQPADPC